MISNRAEATKTGRSSCVGPENRHGSYLQVQEFASSMGTSDDRIPTIGGSQAFSRCRYYHAFKKSGQHALKPWEPSGSSSRCEQGTRRQRGQRSDAEACQEEVV